MVYYASFRIHFDTIQWNPVIYIRFSILWLKKSILSETWKITDKAVHGENKSIMQIPTGNIKYSTTAAIFKISGTLKKKKNLNTFPFLLVRQQKFNLHLVWGVGSVGESPIHHQLMTVTTVSGTKEKRVLKHTLLIGMTVIQSSQCWG